MSTLAYLKGFCYQFYHDLQFTRGLLRHNHPPSTSKGFKLSEPFAPSTRRKLTSLTGSSFKLVYRRNDN